MNTRILSFFASGLLFFFSFDVRAQKDADAVTPLRTDKTLADPSPDAYKPVEVDAREAMEEVAENSMVAGFMEEFLSVTDINDLLVPSDAVGLRFYNAIDDAKTGDVSLVAVAVRADGTEITSDLAKKYRRSSQPIGETIWTLKLGQPSAKTCVANACANQRLVPFTAFFSRSTLQSILRQEGATGIKLIPASRYFIMKDAKGADTQKSYKTMMVIGVQGRSGSLTDIGGTYLKSIEPCPYVCPDDRYLLAPAKY
jgi:hypothetical protein